MACRVYLCEPVLRLHALRSVLPERQRSSGVAQRYRPVGRSRRWRPFHERERQRSAILVPSGRIPYRARRWIGEVHFGEHSDSSFRSSGDARMPTSRLTLPSTSRTPLTSWSWRSRVIVNCRTLPPRGRKSLGGRPFFFDLRRQRFHGAARQGSCDVRGGLITASTGVQQPHISDHVSSVSRRQP